MKTTRKLLSLTASVFALVSLYGCTGSSSDDNIAYSQLELDIENSKTDYDRYETFDKDLLEVYIHSYDSSNTLVRSQIVTDFTVYNYTTESELEDGTVFMNTGYYDCEIWYEDYESIEFNISITNVRSFSQSIEVVSDPERYYHSGETFSADGLELNLVTTYYDVTNTRITREETLEDYTLVIDGESASSYVFEDVGRYELRISTVGTDGTVINETLGCYVLSKDDVSPQKYVDDTIEFKESSTSKTLMITNPNKTSNEDPSGIDYSDKGYYSPNEVSVDYTFYDYGQRNAINWKLAPSTGETPLLVVPAVIPGYEEDATPERLANLEKAFFGDSDEMHYESLHSYYYKSSYGKLDITGTVTDYFYCKDNSSAITSENSITAVNAGSKVRRLAQECASWAQEAYGLDLKDYDSDNDGFIDGMWVVWIGPDYSTTSGYWPFSTTADSDPDYDNPTVNNLGFAGNTFIEDYSSEDGGCDAHVLIHETGHMFGLADYYSYAYSGYDALGNIDMMDCNIGDHNPYSKMMLGWTTPYIVYGNDVTIEIDDLLSENSLIVIPYDSKTYKTNDEGKVSFNPFDEYLVIDCYTDDTKLNQVPYAAYSASPIEGTGIRIYHVDARLGLKGGNATSYSLPDDPDSVWDEENDGRLYTVISNTEQYIEGYTEGYVESYFGLSSSCNAFDEIRLISADGTYLSTSVSASNYSLFQSGDFFSLSSYANQFVSGMFDTKESCSYQIRVR